VEVPRLIVFFVLILSIITITIERFIINKLQDFFLSRDKLEKRNIVFVMKTSEDDVITDALQAKIYNILGYYSLDKIADFNVDYLGSKESLIRDIRARKIDEILFINSDYSPEDIEEIFEYARIYGVRYRYITNYFDVSKTNTELTFLHKIPFMEIRNIGLTPW
jgi:FlaA1/EpsC-like NDP-sugar epimerase